MKPFALFLLALSLLFASTAFAKRGAPAEVPPVRSGDIEYRAPHGQMGCVEAWDVKHDKMLWRRQIYVVKFIPDLERDVQDVYLTSLKLDGKSLLLANERKSEYRLDLDSLQVTVVKGSLVEGKK